MGQEESAPRLQHLGTDVHLNAVETTILELVPGNFHMPGRTIDIPRLQEECRRNGLSPQEFSHGFVRLLVRRLLKPCGEFTYALSAEGDELRGKLVGLKGQQGDGGNPDFVCGAWTGEGR